MAAAVLPCFPVPWHPEQYWLYIAQVLAGAGAGAGAVTGAVIGAVTGAVTGFGVVAEDEPLGVVGAGFGVSLPAVPRSFSFSVPFFAPSFLTYILCDFLATPSSAYPDCITAVCARATARIKAIVFIVLVI